MLANDTDVDGVIVAATVVDYVDNGSLTLNHDGSFTYTPNADFNGTDSFTYRSRHQGGVSATPATVTITVGAVNDVPVTVNDNYTTGEDTTLTVDAPGVRGNDGDVDGVIVAATVVDDVDNGNLLLNNDGSFTYTPNTNFNGEDTFTYTVTDDQSGVSATPTTVTITVNPTNDVPVAGNDSAITAEDSAVTIKVLTNDSDIDGSHSRQRWSPTQPTAPHPQRQRLLHLHPRGRLHRRRLVHLSGQRRHRQQQHGHGERHGQGGEPARCGGGVGVGGAV